MAERIVNSGLELMLNRLIGASGVSALAYQALGQGAGAVSEADTTLWDEVVRKAITSKLVSGGSMVFSTFFFTNEANYTLTEAALFTRSSGGTMFDHSRILPARTKVAALQMVVDVTLTISSAS